MEKLSREFYNRDGLTVAKELLGKTLVHAGPEGITKGRIVETEAYMGTKDKAAHSYKNPASPRTRIQLGEGGYAYIYMIYGLHICMNVVANLPGIPEAVLIRALEPAEGIPLMEKRRGRRERKELCNGPGKLCQAMGITKVHYGEDLRGNVLYIEEGEAPPEGSILRTKRINVDYAKEAAAFLWRYVIRDNPYVSVRP